MVAAFFWEIKKIKRHGIHTYFISNIIRLVIFEISKESTFHNNQLNNLESLLTNDNQPSTFTLSEKYFLLCYSVVKGITIWRQGVPLYGQEISQLM